MITENRKNKKTVLYLGANGFPFGSAMIQRQIQMSKLFLEAGLNVNVINRRGAHSKFITQRERIKQKGYYQGIKYIYCSLIPYRPATFFIRNITKLLGYINELFIIFYNVFFKGAKYFFVNAISLKQLKYYWFLSKILNTKLIYDYVEYIDSINDRYLKEIIDDKKSFDKNFYKYTDKLVFISEYLKNHLDYLAYNKPKINIPPIIDFAFFDRIETKKYRGDSYFLFCGSAAYYDIIIFIIKSFVSSAAIRNNYRLKLVINGSDSQLNMVNKYLNKLEVKESIIIQSNLAYKDLISYYKSANALLIPLTNNLQDQARFPFKICEYTASKRPIITSDTGVIKEYFKNNVNALIVKIDDQSSFSQKMNLIMNEPKFANKIGVNGYELGEKVFNYKTYINEFKEFIVKK